MKKDKALFNLNVQSFLPGPILWQKVGHWLDVPKCVLQECRLLQTIDATRRRRGGDDDASFEVYFSFSSSLVFFLFLSFSLFIILLFSILPFINDGMKSFTASVHTPLYSVHHIFREKEREKDGVIINFSNCYVDCASLWLPLQSENASCSVYLSR